MGYLARLNLRRKIKKESTPHERLRYKKNVLFEFLEDINKNILRDDKIEVIKEVFIKELHFKNTDNQSESTQGSKVSAKKSKTKTKVEKKEEEEEDSQSVYYGIYNSDVEVKKYFEIFQNDIRSNNNPRNKRANFQIREGDETPDESLNLSANPEAKPEKLLETQGQLALHDTHFKYLER